jgi:2,3-bisphosphoglycerate-dependent phosphoglycerate mutase
MPIEVVFETHSWTEDNEARIATGWLPGRLSAAGEELAAALGRRRRDDRCAAIFSSDLARARHTVEIAFPYEELPVFFDWRLRECDYGALNGHPLEELEHEAHIDAPFPQGESWRQAIARVERAIKDLHPRWDGSRVLIVGHVATRLALDHLVLGKPVEDLVSAPFDWQEGWEYVLPITRPEVKT